MIRECEEYCMTVNADCDKCNRRIKSRPLERVVSRKIGGLMIRMPEDEREIKAIYGYGEAGCVFIVGKHCDKIECYNEHGQMEGVPWFAVIKNGVVTHRVNAANIETVSYC